MKSPLYLLVKWILALTAIGNAMLHAQSNFKVPDNHSQNKEQQTNITGPVAKPLLKQQDIFSDEDTLSSASMYQVIQKNTPITFSGSEYPGSSILLIKEHSEDPNPYGEIPLNDDPTSVHCCSTCVSKSYLDLHLHLGGDKHTYEQGTWTGEYFVTVYVELLNGTTVVGTRTETLNVSAADVENVYRLNLMPHHTNTCASSGGGGLAPITKIGITVTGVVFTGSSMIPTREVLRLDANVLEEYKTSVEGCTFSESQIISSLSGNHYMGMAVPWDGEGPPIIYNNPVKFSWHFPVTCLDEFPSYQVQILRLYNIDKTEYEPDDIAAIVDWNQALTFVVEGKKKEIVLTLPEKTGFYVWRVRPIGSYYGGITNPRDWGNWSEAPSQGYHEINWTSCSGVECGLFYYDPDNFDHNKNWVYSRTFTEDDTREPKIFESITYTDGLGQPEQSQSISQADNTLFAQQYLYDLSGRASIHPIPSPVERPHPSAPALPLYLNYLPELTTNSTGALYGPSDVEYAHNSAHDPEEIPANSLSHEYFSDNNTDISVPNADGYPFSQSRYYPDGRVKEVSGIGTEHRLNAGKTTKIYYSGASETELVSVFGKEAPNPSSVTKVVTVDPDKVASVKYTNKEGQVIATCLMNNGEITGHYSETDGYNIINGESGGPLLNLISEKVNAIEIHDDISGGKYKGSGTFSASKSFTILNASESHPVRISFTYEVIPPIMKINECFEYCADCKLKQKIRVINHTTGKPVTPAYEPTISTPAVSPCSSREPQTLTITPPYIDITEPGTYDVERIVEQGTPKPDLNDYLKTPFPTLESVYEKIFSSTSLTPPGPTSSDETAHMYYKTLLNYYNLNYGDHIYPKTSGDTWFRLNNEANTIFCDNFWLPKKECEPEPCDDPVHLDFELYLFREVTENTGLEASDWETAKTYVHDHPDEFDLNQYFKRWDAPTTGSDGKFPTGATLPYYLTGSNPYGRQLFNDIVKNMINETGFCAYNCKKLWDAWRLAVAEYKRRLRKDKVLNLHVGDKIKIEESGIYFDLLERFLDNAGRKLSVKIPPLNYSSPAYTFYDGTTGYLRFPYKILPVNSSELPYDKCYTQMYPDPEPVTGEFCPTVFPTTNLIEGVPEKWAKYDQIRQCLQGEHIDISKSSIIKKLGLYGCVPPSTPLEKESIVTKADIPTDWQKYFDCLKIAGEKQENDCNSSCEKRREEFKKLIWDEYTNPTFTPGFAPFHKYLVGTQRPDNSVVLKSDLDAFTEEEFLCRVEALMANCKGYCNVPNLSFDIHTGLPWLPDAEVDDAHLGDPAYESDVDKYNKRMLGSPKVHLYAIPYDATPDPDIDCPPQYVFNNCAIYSRMYLLAKYLTEKYQKMSKEIDVPTSGYFGTLAKEYLEQSGVTIPSCYDVGGSAYAALQSIIVNPGQYGEFLVQGFDDCGCFLTFRTSILSGTPAVPHPWVVELNSYYNDVWGMKLASPGVMSADTANTSSANPSEYYTVMPYNSGATSGALYNPDIETRTEQLLERLRFYNVNGRTDSMAAFKRSSTVDSMVVMAGDELCFGIIHTGLDEIIHVENPSDSIYGGTWRSYNVGLTLPVPGPGMSIEERGFNYNIHAASKTGTNLNSLGFTHGSSFQVDSLSNITDLTVDGTSDELFNLAAAPEVTGSQKFTDVIGRFEQTPEGYLSFVDYASGNIQVYDYIQFDNYTTKIIGDEDCAESPLCNIATCSICVKWELPPTVLVGDVPSKYRPMSCEEKIIAAIKKQVANEYQKALEKIRERFDVAYKTGCKAGDIVDKLGVSYGDEYYHYTLYYYDRSGNLVQTVPPKGVDIPPVSPLMTRGNMPKHAKRNVTPTSTPTPEYSSTYAYNAFNQSVEQNTIDGGQTTFAYSRQGLLRYSQNARQRATPGRLFSFIRYDDKGRVIQSGQATCATCSTGVSTSYLQEHAVTDDIDDLPIALTGGNSIQFTTTTTYSVPPPSFPPPYNGIGLVQHNLRNRVSYTVYDEGGGYNPAGAGDQLIAGSTYRRVITYYSYDVAGNVEWIIQDIPALNGTSGFSERLATKIDYQYDLISGRVNMVSFRVGYNDRIFERYNYDRNDRIVGVETSRDGVIWDKDASYQYFKHGPLKRTTIGEDSLQGVDYTYTLQGMLKAINHPALDPDRDPGGDGHAGTASLTAFAKDVFGMTLNYYPGDFRRIQGGTQSQFNSIATGSYTKKDDYLAPANLLYSGGITSWAEQVYNPDGTTLPVTPEFKIQTGSLYQYDVIGRLRNEKFQTVSPTTGTFVTDHGYDTDYKYDANGNFTALNRNVAIAGATNPMDELTYIYQTGNNRLKHVDDGNGAVTGIDLADQTATDNYSYDQTGSLKTDAINNIASITWTPFNKVSSVVVTNGASNKTTTNLYGPNGNIVRKTVDASATTMGDFDVLTYYIYDASGSKVLAVYEQKREYNTNTWAFTSSPLKLKEVPIYGLGRLGMMLPYADRGAITGADETFKRTIEKKNYELTDHLGNVRSVFTDMKLPDGTTGKFLPEATTRNYFYPFGMDRPGMTSKLDVSTTNYYRYGYNGMERDNGVSPAGVTGANYSTDFREIDTRVGRWWSQDPVVKPWASPYSTFGNNPISFSDPLGLCEECGESCARNPVNTQKPPSLSDFSAYINLPVTPNVSSKTKQTREPSKAEVPSFVGVAAATATGTAARSSVWSALGRGGLTLAEAGAALESLGATIVLFIIYNEIEKEAEPYEIEDLASRQPDPLPEPEPRRIPSPVGTEERKKDDDDVLYRAGSANDLREAFTPRPGIDDNYNSAKGGLSTFTTITQIVANYELKSGEIIYKLSRKALEDQGFILTEKDGHVGIKPNVGNDAANAEELKKWALTHPDPRFKARGGGQNLPQAQYTGSVIKSIIIKP